nr:hypothetical protein [uncultured Desulfobulbus sp.]
MHLFIRCCLALGLLSLFSHALPVSASPVAVVEQATYPEDEIVRRREVINDRAKKTARSARDKSARLAQVIPIAQALPISGTLQINSGSTSTFYGKLRRDLSYSIRERFVGNLIVTRYFDRKQQRYTGREEYGIDTISMEIDASDFKGKVCSKYVGSPPTCSQWQELDLWAAAEGEEYPGRKSSVVSVSSSGPSVSLRVDGPDILFLSSSGGQGLRSGCGDVVQKQFSREEFKRLLTRKSIKFKTVLGKTFPGCRPGSTVTLEMVIGK